MASTSNTSSASPSGGKAYSSTASPTCSASPTSLGQREKRRIELSLAFALATEQDATLGVGIMLDPFDTPAARQKFLGGFLPRYSFDLSRHDALLVDPSAIRGAVQNGAGIIGCTLTSCRGA
jgi:hypothetical protein